MFGITPAGNFPPPAAEEFPDYIQFQAAGTDLGGADADVLNFSTGLTATRGTGENANVVTVTAEGSAEAAGTYAFRLQSDADLSYSGSVIDDQWLNFDEYNIVDPVLWNQDNQQLEFAQSGLYELVAITKIENMGAGLSDDIQFGLNLSAAIAVNPSAHTMTPPPASPTLTFTDTFLLGITDGDPTCSIGVYAGTSGGTYQCTLGVIVRRLSDYTPPA